MFDLMFARQVQPPPGLDVIGSPKAVGCTHGYCCSGPIGPVNQCNYPRQRKIVLEVIGFQCNHIDVYIESQSKSSSPPKPEGLNSKNPGRNPGISVPLILPTTPKWVEQCPKNSVTNQGVRSPLPTSDRVNAFISRLFNLSKIFPSGSTPSGVGC